MKSERDATPDRREFMLRLGGAAVYGVPIVALLGAAKPNSDPEQIAKRFAAKKGAREWVVQLYTEALSRPPEPAELEVGLEALGDPPSPDGLVDLIWAVVMQPEFQLLF